MIDMGNPLLNLTVDGFLKIGTVISLHSSLHLLIVFSLFLKIPNQLTFCRFISLILLQVAATRAVAEDTYHILRKGKGRDYLFPFLLQWQKRKTLMLTDYLVFFPCLDSGYKPTCMYFTLRVWHCFSVFLFFIELLFICEGLCQNTN